METAFGIILVVIFLLIVMRPVLQRWFGPWIQRWMMGKMEDRMRRMMGMPTRKEEKKARKQAGRRQTGGAERFRQAAQGRRAGSRRSEGPSGVDMLQGVAEDVEYTEIKTYSEDLEIGISKEGKEVSYKLEHQIEDAEIIEIRKDGEDPVHI